MEYTEEEGQRLVAEFMAKMAARPVKARYPAATENSTTERGGQVIATSDNLSGLSGRLALVGDIVRYADGSEARIITGAGVALVHNGRSIALVGSKLDNGDTITGPAHDEVVIVQYADEGPIDGLLDSSFAQPTYEGGLDG